MVSLSAASCTAEFVGTFLLVLTVGCNVMSQNAVWAGVSIACVLMVNIYALGAASGANFNPAVSVALGLTKKMDDGWKQVCVYSAVQVVAGLAASLCYSALFGPFDLGPSKGFTWWQAMVCEVFYTFMLCFVVLNTAASKKIGGGRNQFYGLAIGFVIIAGAYGAGAVSGGCFNPAVAIAIDSSSVFLSGFGGCVLYTIAELAGAAIAAALFLQCRPEERTNSQVWSGRVPEDASSVADVLYKAMKGWGTDEAAIWKAASGIKSQASWGAVQRAFYERHQDLKKGDLHSALKGDLNAKEQQQLADTLRANGVDCWAKAGTYAVSNQRHPEDGLGTKLDEDPGMMPKLTCEFIGTFMLVLTVGLNVLASSKAGAFSIAASLMCMIMAVGDISGGHFNPAVTLAVFLSGRGKINAVAASKYVVAQVLGGVAAAFVYALVYKGRTFSLGPKGGHGWLEVAVAETIFTFVLTLVVLCVASTKKPAAPEMTGFIIGSCVTVGGFAIGGISGGSLNPAVSMGIAAANVMNGGFFFKALIYSAFELFGAAVAAGVFAAAYPSEYDKEY